MPSDLLKRDLAGLQHPDQRRPRDAQHVSRLLGRQTLILRRHRHGQSSTHRIHDLKKGLSHRGREVNRLTIDGQPGRRTGGCLQFRHYLGKMPGDILLRKVGLALNRHGHGTLQHCCSFTVFELIVLSDLSVNLSRRRHKARAVASARLLEPQATNGTTRSQPHSAARTVPIGVRVAPRIGASSTMARVRKDRSATSSTGPTPGRTTSGSPALA